ncbi:ATP-binding cassette domain-containing protein [Campylobacter sp. US33a]|uniref:ATP-binding cassette domain-containing protein n=1 Tax=Campylobacter sp. CCS1377 TaxID=3158229 RepID=A0AAU7E784_9BACT|nr:ATP-binding cassette domain-containing protein [Campylobacter sp. US33a]TEY04000.1 ABC transporter ATP-binding protein [Campylobacter sp. US33a]
MIEINNLQFAYNDKKILSIEKLEIASDKISILMGENGSGKSTFLRILSFLEGKFDISYWGKKNLNLEEKRQIRLHLAQPILLNRSVKENFIFALKTYKIKNTKERIEEALEYFKLEKNLLKKNKNELSSGQIQKISLALDFALRAKFYLLDEPSAFLDKESIVLLKNAIIKMKKEHKSGFLIASHDKIFLDTLADFKFYLHSGNILEFENTNVFALENSQIDFGDILNFYPFDEGKIAINPYEIHLNNKQSFVINKAKIIAIRNKKNNVFIRVLANEKILEFALDKGEYLKKNLKIDDIICLSFNKNAIKYLN